jgi:hypothetical protein
MDEFEELQRRIQLDRERRPIEEQARHAHERGDWEQAITLWKRSCDLAVRGGDEISRWYVEGQLADVLIKAQRIAEATHVLETSVAAGNDLPFAHGLLVDLCMQQRRYADACRIQRESWRSTSARAEANGMPPIDPSPAIIRFAKWWKDTDSAEPIALAEQWANDARARDARFAVRHERAAMLEKTGDVPAALELYLELIREGSKHDATYTRAMLLLDRAKRGDEALELARSILGRGLSASVEEQARKRIVKLEARVSKQREPKGRQAKTATKAQVPSFSIRAGDSSLTWLGQIELKGGFSSIVPTDTGVFATGGTQPALWWIEEGAQAPVHLRAIDKRTRLFRGTGLALVTDEGTVSEGGARIELVASDWKTAATLTLPGVTSEVAIARWGIAVGCRAGGLYGVGWNGVLRWRFDLPMQPDESSFARPCPYYLSSAPDIGGVVFSSFANVYAITEDGALAWEWRIPAPPAVQVHALVGTQMPTASVSCLRATRDGGAWVCTQSGGIFRLDGRGRVTWTSRTEANIADLLADVEDRLVALAHSGGVALANASGALHTVIASSARRTLARSEDGRLLLVTEGKVVKLLDASGAVRAVVEFSRAIAGAEFWGTRIVVAAGKLEAFGAVS